ncbi:cell division protein FtsZ [Maribacter hydrothermalis]|uniref:Cell division protein FtsZ n=1 Tax=Maribacter hydrothermalis TaxID=1836467 RepID=A0A1B7ZE05_9FLAO|nr:cell division protein FtsZ [Maribacter hydrothermalis]APQ16558.1 cell division protein FtsZ [Maribacter hydrothermalis]OBR41536.1 cell division protein FtsZ [Maribacter hydrothermalis]
MSKNSEFDNISFDLPKNQSNVIKVIGVGGGGSNAINHMFQAGINGVDFVICNTDSQALDNSPVPNKIQLGVSLTEGLGAGANPEVGEQAAMESMEEIKTMLDSTTKMIFITAGMGGGTGTGAAPVIAKFAKEMDVLTVGIVTMPFQFEGKMRVEQAQRGIEKLRKNVDSLIVINNNKLREVYGNLGFKAGFSKADEVLATAARGIAEVITHHYTQNIDLRDAKTVLSNSGTAIMGSAISSGSARANEAIMKALDSPLLNDNKIQGAKNVLLLIVSGAQEITIDEIGEINDHIQIEAGYGANIIMGVGEDESLGEAIAVTVIATGFNIEQQDDIVNTESKKIIHTLEDGQRAEAMLLSNSKTVHTLEMDEVEEEVVKVNPVKKYEFVEESDFDLIPTTNYIKNFNVFYEEVLASNISEDEFVIIDAPKSIRDIEVVDPEVLKIKDEDDNFALSFDFKSQEEESENVIMFDLHDEVKDLDVNDSIEVIPVLEYNKQGEKRYSLDDYMKFENKLTGAKSKAEEFEPKIIQDELIFEKKTVAPRREVNPDEQLDPMETPIEELLRDRADERRRKLKDFNYKFKTSTPSSYDDKKPAYQRQGVNLNDNPRESKISRTSLSDDSNDDIQLRSNNSFLHDNVD